MVMVAPNGTTVALKMLDGGARASTIVAATLLARAGGLSDADVTGLADSCRSRCSEAARTSARSVRVRASDPTSSSPCR